MGVIMMRIAETAFGMDMHAAALVRVVNPDRIQRITGGMMMMINRGRRRRRLDPISTFPRHGFSSLSERVSLMMNAL